MFLAHSFRLRDPWQREPADDGSVRWTRGFHRPTGLEADDALWLVISGLPEGAAVSVNGRRLEPPLGYPHGQFEVTSLLADSNQIEIAIPPSLPTAHRLLPTSFPYDVRLGVIGRS